MHIFFQFGEFSGDENSFLSDLIVAIVGAFIGTGGAIILYYLQTKEQKKKEVINLYNTQRDQLEYLTILLENTIKTTQLMINELTSVSDSAIKIPSKKLFLTLTVNNDLNRIVNKINQDSYFLAYKALINDDKIGKILSSVDFLFETLEDVKLYYIKINNFQQDERKEFLYSMQNLINTIMANKNEYQKKEGIKDKNFLFLNKYHTIYASFFNSDIDELEIFNKRFLNPLLLDLHYNNYPSEHTDIFNAAKDSSILLSRLILRNQVNGNHLMDYSHSLSKALDILKDQIIPLTKFVKASR